MGTMSLTVTQKDTINAIEVSSSVEAQAVGLERTLARLTVQQAKLDEAKVRRQACLKDFLEARGGAPGVAVITVTKDSHNKPVSLDW